MNGHPQAAADLQPETPTAPRPMSCIGAVALGLIVLAFGLIRAVPLFNDLWLDELWTLWHLEQLRSVGEIFSRFLHDNNHPLNTLWMYLVMSAKADWAYRLLAWVGGTAAVWLSAKIARLQFLTLHPHASPDQVRTAELLTASLFGSSYLLIVYSSEARGYGPVLGLGMLAIYALFHDPSHRRDAWAVVYWAASILGLLAHAVFYQLVVGGIVFTVVHAFQNKSGVRALWTALGRTHAVPVTFAVFYYAAFVRRLEIVGGPENSLFSVLGELAAYSVGVPARAGAVFALPLLLVAAVIALTMIWRRAPALACFYVTAMVAFPALALIFSPFVYVFPRYFILSSALALLLTGYFGAALWNFGPLARRLVLGAAVLIVAGNFAHISALLRYGRGEYKAALRYIVAHTPSGEITICSDHDGRNILLIHHHGPSVIQSRRLRYIAANDETARGAQWLLVHRLDGAPIPDPHVLDHRGNPFRFERVFRHAPLSGWDWYLYRNQKLLP